MSIIDLLALAPRLGPGDVEVDDGGALGRRLDEAERLQDDATLQLHVEGRAEQVPHAEGHEHGSRGVGMLGDVASTGHRHRRDATSFDGALDQRDALVANGSGGGGERNIGCLLLDCRGDVLGNRRLE